MMSAGRARRSARAWAGRARSWARSTLDQATGRRRRRLDHLTYSQSGEDRICRAIFAQLDVPEPTYLDIGAHHPSRLNNTFLFYRMGATGTCVEPDPLMAAEIRRTRPRDRVLEVGIGPHAGVQPFYVFRPSTLNTFSEQTASTYRDYGHRLVEIIEVPVRAVDELLAQVEAPLDLVSLDTEGDDAAILGRWNFATHRPKVFCVETLVYTPNPEERRKVPEIGELLREQGYWCFADTFINSVFVDGGLLPEP